MQLDRTRIVIRERDYFDVLDMALRTISADAGRLLAAWAVGALPAVALNVWLLADFAQPRMEFGYPPEYVWYALLLAIAEMPLATAAITLYLGQAIFTDRAEPRKLARSFLDSLPQLLWYQGFVRALLIPLHVTWFFLFAAWPFASEVILLERNRMRRTRRDAMTTGRRIAALHNGMRGELLARWLLALLLGGLLFGSLYGSIWIADGMLLARWEPSGLGDLILSQLALWLVIGFFTVVRFLSYLDLRIRREGWEVELLMRAEGARLKRSWT